MCWYPRTSLSNRLADDRAGDQPRWQQQRDLLARTRCTVDAPTRTDGERAAIAVCDTTTAVQHWPVRAGSPSSPAWRRDRSGARWHPASSSSPSPITLTCAPCQAERAIDRRGRFTRIGRRGLWRSHHHLDPIVAVPARDQKPSRRSELVCLFGRHRRAGWDHGPSLHPRPMAIASNVVMMGDQQLAKLGQCHCPLRGRDKVRKRDPRHLHPQVFGGSFPGGDSGPDWGMPCGALLLNMRNLRNLRNLLAHRTCSTTIPARPPRANHESRVFHW